MVEITLHDTLGVLVGKSKWKLAVKSVSEAIHAINILTGGKLNKVLKDLGQEKFEVKINNHLFKKSSLWENNLNDINTIEEIKDSELCFNFKKLEKIDIVPVIRAADSDVFALILGVILIIVGVVLIGTPFGAPLILAGIGLVAAGVMNMLASPPKFDDFAEIDRGGKRSYLFNGPQNTIREGGPVPLGYGRALIGSQTISASYEISNIAVSDGDASIIPPDGSILAFNIGGPTIGYFYSANEINTQINRNSAWIKLFTDGGAAFYEDGAVPIINNYANSGPKEIYNTNLRALSIATPLKIQLNVGNRKNPEQEFFTVRLHFADLIYGQVGNRQFTVQCQGVLSDPSPINVAQLGGGLGYTYTYDFERVVTNSSGTIEILLTAISAYPRLGFISAVEIYEGPH